MSTKIYTAWRFRKKHLPEFMDHVWKKTYKITKEEARRLLPSGDDPDVLAKLKKEEEPEDKYREAYLKSAQKNVLEERVKKAKASAYHNWYDLDTSWGIWQDKLRCYVIPYYPDPILRKLVKGLPSFMEEYAYFNNSDGQLEYLTPRQWDARRKKWNTFLDNGRWQSTRLTYHILEVGNGSIDLPMLLMDVLSGEGT